MDQSLYDELWQTEQDHWWFIGRRRIVRSLIERFSTSRRNQPLKVCELGCGTGGNIASWADEYDVVGVDASKHALQYARQRLGSRVAYGRLPDEIPFAGESFDIVLLTDVFEHIDDDRASAETALSLLRPGGILVATVPAYQWLYSPRDRHHQHFRRYSKQQFRQLFDVPGVEVELLSHYNSLLFPPAAIVRAWSKLFGRRSRPGDLRVPPSPINKTLTAVFGLEQKLLGKIVFPFGLSLVAVVRRGQAESIPLAA